MTAAPATMWLAAFDARGGADGIASDVDALLNEGVFGGLVLFTVLALPIAAIGALLASRAIRAALALAIGSGIIGLWFLYYATEVFSSPGQGVWLPAVAAALAGWVLGVSAFRGGRR